MVSGCLFGIRCRYDGGQCASPHIIHFSSKAKFIPFCPEQLGGLPTPRTPANIVGGDGRDVLCGRARVITKAGEDVTDAYKKGAEESLRLARLAGAKIAVLKGKSPSCGLNTPYCEKSSDSGMGVTAALFHLSGIITIDVDPVGHFPSANFLRLVKKIS